MEDKNIRSDAFYSVSKICPICHRVAISFLPAGKRLRDDAECPVCGSYERHRGLWNFISMLSFNKVDGLFLNPPGKMKQYVKEYGFDTIDINNLNIENKKYNVIVCSNQLSKVSDYKSLLKKIYLMLSDNGVLLLGLWLKKSSSEYYIPDLRKALDDFVGELREIGFITEYKWNKDIFLQDSMYRYSILPDEFFIECRTSID